MGQVIYVLVDRSALKGIASTSSVLNRTHLSGANAVS